MRRAASISPTRCSSATHKHASAMQATHAKQQQKTQRNQKRSRRRTSIASPSSRHASGPSTATTTPLAAATVCPPASSTCAGAPPLAPATRCTCAPAATEHAQQRRSVRAVAAAAHAGNASQRAATHRQHTQQQRAHTCDDGAGRQPGSELRRHGADALGRQAVLAGREHAHHEFKQAAADRQLAVEKDAAQEGPEEAVDDVWRKALGLRSGNARCTVTVNA